MKKSILLKKVLLLSAVSAFAVSCNSNSECSRIGVNYYLDSDNGSDSNDGLTAESAWKSLDKINKTTLNPGDSVLLKRGAAFNGIMEVSAKGTAANRIVIDAYGDGEMPHISAPDSCMYAVCIRNSDYVTLQNIEVSNTGTERMPSRTGVKVSCENYGTSHNIVLNALYVHDVNGVLKKFEGGGSGILITSHWDKDKPVSVFDSLTVENCIIRRCERNAIIWGAPWSRQGWHLSTNTVVRKNLIEEVPGDGIVPIGCDGAIIEYNLMRKCTATMPDNEAAAGIWPWSCDNTVIQFNEVSDHKAPWDGQGFDSDYNCTNTTIQYNYSHDNDGGFLLICNSGEGAPDNIGNVGSIVQYNVSIGDAVRQRTTRESIFSPTIHVAGPCKNTLVEHNILHVTAKPSKNVDRKIITSNSWNGYADSTFFSKNVFFTAEPSTFNMTQSTNNHFNGNYYLGAFNNKPADANAREASQVYEALDHATLFNEVTVGNGTATLKAVNKTAIETLFSTLDK